jgi:hypothetical protein
MSAEAKPKGKYAENKKKYYNDNKFEINKARIIRELTNPNKDGKTRSPSIKTLRKYGLLDETGTKVELNNKPKFQIAKDIQTKPDVVNVVVKNVITPTEQYDMSNTEITGKQISDWVMTVVSTKPKGKSGKVRNASTIKTYADVPYKLSELRSKPYDENADIKKSFVDAADTIEYVNKWEAWSEASKAKFIQAVLYILGDFPPFRTGVSPDVIKIYEAELQKLENTARAIQINKKNDTPVFVWSYLRRLVREKYTINSYEYLMVLLYNQVHGRDDLGLIMAYKPEDMTDDKNYLYLDRKNRRATVYLNKYKTSDIYGKQVVQLSAPTYLVIVALHPNDSEKLLFPFLKKNKDGDYKMSDFIHKTFANIPQFKNENIGVRYIRHSITSSALAEIRKDDPQYGQKVAELAQKHMHTVKAQQLSYLTPLKDGNGKRIDIDNHAFQKAYDDVTEVRTGNEKDDSDGEDEVSSKPKGSKATKAKPKERMPPITEKPKKPAAKKKTTVAQIFPIGSRVRKRFVSEHGDKRLRYYHGKVASYDGKYYHIKYTDGDEEDYDEKEMKKYSYSKKN